MASFRLSLSTSIAAGTTDRIKSSGDPSKMKSICFKQARTLATLIRPSLSTSGGGSAGWGVRSPSSGEIELKRGNEKKSFEQQQLGGLVKWIVQQDPVVDQRKGWVCPVR